MAKQKSGIWLCRASLLIDMSESAEEYPTEEETSPEVLFEHDVFVGAEKVQLYYEITVQRENQLKMSTGPREMPKREKGGDNPQNVILANPIPKMAFRQSEI